MVRVGCLICCAVASVGCAANTRNLVARGELKVELEPVRKGHYRDIQAYVVDGGLRVVGHIRRQLKPGSLEVEILSGTRELLAEQRVDLPPSRGSRVRYTTFEAFLPTDPERVCVLRLIHRPGTK